MTSASDLVYDAFYEQMKNTQMMSLSGVGHYHDVSNFECADEECLGVMPLVGIEDDLQDALTLAEELRNHSHKWNEQGFCWCGWDGNA